MERLRAYYSNQPRWKKIYMISAIIITILFVIPVLFDSSYFSTISPKTFLEDILGVFILLLTLPVGLIPLFFVFGSTLANSGSHDTLGEQIKFIIVYPIIPLMLNALIYIAPLRRFIKKAFSDTK